MCSDNMTKPYTAFECSFFWFSLVEGFILFMKNIIVEEQIKISAKYLFRLGPTIGIFYFFFINKIEAINYELKD